MTNGLTVKILNTAEEINSLPVNQKIRLEFSSPVEDSFLKESIYLTQALDSGSIIHIGDTYNQNVGLVKESFSNVAVTFKVISESPFRIEVNPVNPLTPGHTYLLTVVEGLEGEYVDFTKTSSLGPSTGVCTSVGTLTQGEYSLDVLADSTFKSGKHTTTVSFNGLTKTVTVVDNTAIFTVGEASFKLSGSVFLKGESFKLTVSNRVDGLSTSFQQRFKVASTASILPIEREAETLSLEDIFKYNEKEEEPLKVIVQHICIKKFLVIFNKEVANDVDIENISFSKGEAFNMYTLSSLDLYKDEEISLVVKVKDNFTLEVEVVYEGTV